jgi:hypothetical protein
MFFFLIQECCLASAWYEVLSVVHMMAMLALFEANLLLIPKSSQGGGERKVAEGLSVHLSEVDIHGYFDTPSNFCTFSIQITVK